MNNFIQLLDRPIAYNPSFAKLRVGNVKSGPVAAVFLSQMVYWYNRMDGGWIYKTQADIASETALSRDEQETARKRLVALGVLDEERRGVPATMHYRVNAPRLEELLLATTRPVKKEPKVKTRLRHFQNVETPHSGLVHSHNQECGDAANKNVETPQTSLGETNKQACGNAANFLTGNYTENTQETTQKKNTSGQPPTAADRNHKISEEIHVTDQAILVLKHLNQVTGAKYTTAKSTLENLRARLGEGFTVDELILTADYLNAKWASDLEMAEYLRPATMFQPSKFPGYFSGAQKWLEAGRPKRVNGRWVSATGETLGEGNAERDAAYRRFIGSGKPLKSPSQLEQTVTAEASKAGVRSMNASFAVSRWNSIWKECAARQQGEHKV
ncbi:conserved phage C-terminal domain-containing protein [Erwinia amylovora]|uniref:conserved phage C-terminal domain-containing protein n=1 Tax=Erwinia amylovora TaxID=552 RepID=UPI001443D62B|nr:conserved phage C-terminal domain-containing protein [Erwinia amylovora]